MATSCFSTLRQLLFELCTFHEVIPDQSALSYRHDELGRCFGSLLAELARHLRPVYALDPSALREEQRPVFAERPAGRSEELAGGLSADSAPDAARAHGSQRGQGGLHFALGAGASLGPARCSVQTLSDRRLRTPLVPRSISISCSSGRWNYVLREAALAFYVHPVLEKASAFLFGGRSDRCPS